MALSQALTNNMAEVISLYFQKPHIKRSCNLCFHPLGTPYQDYHVIKKLGMKDLVERGQRDPAFPIYLSAESSRMNVLRQKQQMKHSGDP